MAQVPYMVQVHIHDVRDLKFSSGGDKGELPNPRVDVVVNGDSRSTPKRERTAATSFNQNFTYTQIMLNRDDFLKSTIEIRVVHCYLFTTQLIGSWSLSFDSVYRAPQHFMDRQLILIRDPDNPSESTGVVRISVGVFGPKDDPPAIKEDVIDDEGAGGGNIMDRVQNAFEFNITLYQLSVNIHKGMDLPKTNNNGFVQVSFSGVKQKTETKPNNTNPDWNQCAKISASVPSIENMIVLELWDVGTLGRQILLGTGLLDFSQIAKQRIVPRWINFYWNPPLEGVGGFLAGAITNLVQQSKQEQSTYAGRILVSADLIKIASPINGVGVCQPVLDPPTVEHTLWIDLYECNMLDGDHPEIYLEFSIGATVWTSPPIRQDSNSYVWLGGAGRFAEVNLHLPDISMCWDFCMYIVSKGLFKTSRVSYLRLPIKQVMTWKDKPIWYNLKMMDGSSASGGYVLASINLGPRAEAPLPRKPRRKYQLVPHLVRAGIHQAVALPMADNAGLSDPFCKVSLAGKHGQTRPIMNTINPVWHEAFEFEALIPEDKEMAPDLIVEVFDHDDSIVDNTPDLLGSFRLKCADLPLAFEGDPQWFPLESEAQQGGTQGQLLAYFELVPLERAEEFPFYDDIIPSARDCVVSLFLIGIRLNNNPADVAPQLEIAYGREVDETDKAVWAEKTESTNVTGGEGCFNYMQAFEIPMDIPKNPIFQVFIEAAMFEWSTGLLGVGGGAYSPTPSGACYIHINPHFPWLTDDVKLKLAKDFEMKTVEETALRQVEAAIEAALKAQDNHGALEEGDDGLDDELSPERKYELEMARNPECQIPTNDPDASNKRRLREDEWDAVFDDRHPPITVNEEDTVLEKGVAAFEWHLDTTKQGERIEVPYALEQDLPVNELPFSTSPIIRKGALGTEETVGFLKFKLKVMTKKMYKDDSVHSRHQQEINELKRRLNEARNLVVRAYILSASALVSRAGNDPSAYVWIKTGETEKVEGTKNFRDSQNLRRQGIAPEFNRCYVLECALPENSKLTISMMHASLSPFPHECIGTTSIMLEDRWFHPKWQEMMRTNKLPVEIRPLRSQGVQTNGLLRAWYEIMTPGEAQAKPLESLANPDPEDCQMRVVIWGADKVPMDDAGTVSVFVKASYQQDDGTIVSFDTDTHYNSESGSAKFNWRFIFDIKIPSQYPTLKLQIWSWGVTSSEALSECSVDLQGDFARAKKTHAKVLIPRTNIKCTHPSYPGQIRGQVDCEICLVPGNDAKSDPVGKGREEPNKDPFLEEVTENRNYILTTDLAKNTVALAAAAVESAQRMWKIGAGVMGIAVLVALALFIKQFS